MELENKLIEKGAENPDEILRNFDRECILTYLRFLDETEKKYSLFSKSDAERILERHFFESAVIVSTLYNRGFVSRETKVVDVGTGAGLPGYLFNCLKEPPRLTLMDSSRRKLGLLEDWLDAHEIKTDIEFTYERVEESRGSYDLVIARALSRFPHVVELLMSVVKLNGHICLAHSNAEIGPEESEYLSRLGFVSRETIGMPELKFLGKRTLIILKKERKPAKGYPRIWKKIKEEIEIWAKSSQ